jgi:hypothetical protein
MNYKNRVSIGPKFFNDPNQADITTIQAKV